MTFVDLQPGDAVFLDANGFIYHFAADPVHGVACTQLLQRIDNLELQAFTSTHILSEVAHRLMTMEASNRFGWPFTGIVYKLAQHPTQVMQLSTFRTAIDHVLASPIQVLSVTPAQVAKAAVVSQQTGLLSNDALTVALMQDHGLTKLASFDADFDRVSGLTRYAP